MPRDIGDAHGVDPIDFAECVARLDEQGCDLSSEDGLAKAALLLARLHANRDFLIDLAIAELKDRCAGQQAGNRYGAQVLMLARREGAWFIRANFWPAADDPVLLASGPSHYFYHVPHDHNFDFLTVGYIGPGYRSNWYAAGDTPLAGVPGEAAALRLVEQGALTPGRMLHYRAHHDVHDQLPPDALSISLNIVPDDAGAVWRNQYLFDTTHNRVQSLPTLSQGEIILRIAAQLGGGNGLDLAHHLAAHHPSNRARWNAWVAIAGREEAAGRCAIYERASHDPSRHVSMMARLCLDRMDAEPASVPRPGPSARKQVCPE